ncbi:hypothetical protein VNI00_012552 [Paramarasmius palmivorus]|uniref:F-box domain-containing protein n=1 Tax=Paramarasmius palmivorus TaxID=297713 RepID=A0AAW0C6E7_9AGAR
MDIFQESTCTSLRYEYEILNLDKVQTLGWQTLHHLLFGQHSAVNLLCDLLTTETGSESWAGDRIICRRRETYEYPAGLLTKNDRQNLSESRFKCITHESIGSEYPPGTFSDKPTILRNVTKGQYVCLDAFELEKQSGLTQRRLDGPTLGSVLLSRICWASDAYTEPVLEQRWLGEPCLDRGAWAGDRFDFQRDISFLREGVAWKNVTEWAVRFVVELWWRKYHVRYNTVKPRTTIPLEPRLLRHLPWEITSTILQELALEDRAAGLDLCKDSRTIQRVVYPILYRNPVVDTSRMNTFMRELVSSYYFDHPITAGDTVRRICLPEPNSDVLSFCPNVECLLLDWGGYPSSDIWAEDDEDSEWPAPSMIIFGPCSEPRLPSGAEMHPLFRGASHLCINYSDVPSLLGLDIRNLCRLTHLAIRVADDEAMAGSNGTIEHFIRRVLISFPEDDGLMLLLLISESVTPFMSRGWTDVAKIPDPRLFARPRLREADYEQIMGFDAHQSVCLERKPRGTIWDGIEVNYKDWRDKVCIADRNIVNPPLSEIPEQFAFGY